MDFPHDVQLHPPADMAAWRTHEQPVLYQAAKLCTFPAHDAENLMFKEKLPVGGILHVRGHSYIFHTLVFFRFYGGGVGGVVRPCPLFSWGGEKDVPDVVSGTCSPLGVRRLFRFRVSPFSGRRLSSPSFLLSAVFPLLWLLSFPLSSFPLSFLPNVHAVSDILPRGWL